MPETTDRFRIMRSVKSIDTKPEMAVRRLVHGMGFRYRLHRADLPGKPDLVFPSRRGVIFVHGCWWHGHDCRRGAREPKTNQDYWAAKIGRNRRRDNDNRLALEALGWRVLVVGNARLGIEKLFESGFVRFWKIRPKPPKSQRFDSISFQQNL